MRKIMVTLVAVMLLLGIGIAAAGNASAVVTQPPIQGSHTIRYYGFGVCGTTRYLDMEFTITGNQFQMDKVTYHGPTMSKSPYILLDNWRGVTGAGAGSGTAARVFPAPVADGAVATRTSNHTGGNWLSKTLETTPLNNPNESYNFLDPHFDISGGCVTRFNLASWSTFPSETPFDADGDYVKTLTCTSPTGKTATFNIDHSIEKIGNTWSLYINLVQQTSTDPLSDYFIHGTKPTTPGSSEVYGIAGSSLPSASYVQFNYHDSTWTGKPTFELFPTFADASTCYSGVVVAGGGW